jgi:hypothetical protein
MKKLQSTILKRLAVREPVTHAILRMYVNAKGFRITSRGLRRVISDLKDKGGHLIISSPKGLKMANTLKEFERYLKYKKRYLKAIAKDIRKMERNFKRASKPQLFA